MMLNQYLVLIVVINVAYSSDYVYRNLFGTFHNRSKIEISVIADRYNGFYIYAFDFHGNKILMKFDELSGNNLNITFNNFFAYTTINTFCGCSKCNEIAMTIIISIEKDKLTIKCNGNAEIKIDEKMRHQKYQSKQVISDKISIKIGTSKQQVGKFFSNYKMVGCLDHFFYNNEVVNFNSFGNSFLPSCITNIYETICNQSSCQDHINKQHIYYCLTVNRLGKSVYQDTLKESINPSSFTTIENSTPIFTAKLTITNPNFRNICLFELKLKDENIIQFHYNQFDNVVLSYWKSNQIIFHKNTFQNKVVLLSGFTVMFSLNNTAITMKICHKNHAYKYIENLNTSIKSVYVGMSSGKTNCKKFDGTLSVQYDSESLTLDKYSYAIVIILVIFGTILLISVMIGLAIYLKSTKAGEKRSNAVDETIAFVEKV